MQQPHRDAAILFTIELKFVEKFIFLGKLKSKTISHIRYRCKIVENTVIFLLKNKLNKKRIKKNPIGVFIATLYDFS